MNAKPGTQSTPLTKKELILLLNAGTLEWETLRRGPGNWTGMVRIPGKTIRASATNERQLMKNLCKGLGLL